MKKTVSKSFGNLLSEVITSPKKFISFLALILLTVVIVVSALYIVVNIFSKKASSIEVKASGALVIQLDKDLRTASYLLSANGNDDRSPWIDTNIDIKEGDKITFHVSGKVCMAMHRMLDAAKADTIMPPLPWCGPEGFDLKHAKYKRGTEEKRKKHLISPNHNHGQVIGIISSQLPTRLAAEDIIDINAFSDKSYLVENRKGHLWLTINEVFLDDAALDTLTASELAIDEAEFNFIKKNHYSNVWYEDNCGFFSINMEICH